MSPKLGGDGVGREKSPVRTLVVDDIAVSQQLIRCLLENREDIHVVGTAFNGRAALRLAEELNVDLVRMDIQMPGMDGLEATRRLVQRFPDVPVIIVTIHDAPEVQRACPESGARGFVTKERLDEDLYSEIHRIISGQPDAPRRAEVPNPASCPGR